MLGSQPQYRSAHAANRIGIRMLLSALPLARARIVGFADYIIKTLLNNTESLLFLTSKSLGCFENIKNTMKSCMNWTLNTWLPYLNVRR